MDAIMNSPVMQMLSDPVLYIGLGQGLLLTLQIAGTSIVLSFVFGTIIGAMRYSGFPGISHLATTYIEVVRNLPQLLLILVSYFVLGLPAMWAATIGLTMISRSCGRFRTTSMYVVARWLTTGKPE